MIHAIPHNGVETSREAADSMLSHVERLEQMVLGYIAGRGEHGATCDEAEVALGLSHQTCSPRFTTLSRSGRITDIGSRRTRSGRRATVWAAV